MRVTTNIRQGAAYGFIAWGAFAAVEIASCSVRTLALGYYDLVEPAYWLFTAILLPMYLLFGILFGALAGYLLDRSKAFAFRPEAAMAPLVVFYIINVITEPHGWDLPQWVALVVSLAIFGLLAASLAQPDRFRWARLLADPWFTAGLLLGLPLLAGAFSIRNSIAIVLGLAIAAFVSLRFLSNRETGSLPFRQLAATVVALGAVLIATAALSKDMAPVKEAALKSVGSKPPNVVLVVMDTVRADHLSLYGYSRDTTPNLKKFAQGATVYHRATATSNFTLPTHASLFTGLYARAHGATNAPYEELPHALGKKYETMAEYLTAAGYLSLAESANIGFVRPDYGLDQGFNVFDVRQSAPCVRQGEAYQPRRLMRRLVDLFYKTFEFDRIERAAEPITTDAIRLAEEAHRRGRPLFLFINYMDVHDYLPPAPYDAMFPGRKRALTPEYIEMVNDVIAHRRSVTKEEFAHFVSQYDGSLRYLDDQIARLMRRLTELGIYDNSLIVITSDHGEAFGERNFVGHRQSVYQDQVYVPLVIKYPGQTEARTEDWLVSQVDLLPTILTAAGLSVPQGLHGENLLQLDGNRSIFAEAYVHAGMARLQPKHPPRQFAVFRDNWKLISNANGKTEMYDLAKDPHEGQDLYGSERAAVKEYLTRLEDWMQAIPMQIQPAKQVDPRTLERLKALGYVQ